ncbi:hypothetical protein F5Y03DRAFT_393300 [Xylaria venustula]|nr:hypothetical protein F5Y03DRAFT_393300 [Xylaria venustula]
MKFGERLDSASVPGWSLHNVDYNSLKHQIKTHTAKDQAAATAAAITIPGHQDHTLRRFEDGFYLELCAQHSRVGLFVTSKADEISRRLQHISTLVHRLMLKCDNDTGDISTKRKRRFIKYHTQTEECGQDIEALGRFVDAQITAFRKILKKYKKWTGSTTLGSRFKENVLDHPKSFTHYNFAPLQAQYRQLRATLEAASFANPDTNTNPNILARPPLLPTESHDSSTRRARRDSRRSSNSAATIVPPPPTYWNEYDHGSEAGDRDDDAYVIYIDPDAEDGFPGLAYVKNMFVGPVDSVRHWLHKSNKQIDTTTAAVSSSASPSETQSLLGQNTGVGDYFGIASSRHTNETTTDDDEYLSSQDGAESRHPPPHSVIGSLEDSSYYSSYDSKMGLYQDRMLTRAVIVTFATAFVLLGISGLLVATGRRRLRVEVDAGAAVGSVASLFCACMGLGAMLYRQYPGGYMYVLAVWVTFVTVCVLNGILLVLVVGSSGL